MGDTDRRAHPARSGAPAAAGTRAPVLIVDDHQLVGSSLALSLRAEGLDARFDPVGSGPGVLACATGIAGRARAGLVVLDLDLGRDPAGHRIDGVALVARCARPAGVSWP